MAGDVFFIGDPHLGHRKVAAARGFDGEFGVFDHTHTIISRWNQAVSKKDVVFVLGDFVWSKSALGAINALHGTKKLILGNHDLLTTRLYIEAGINKLYGALEWRDRVLLTHVPVHPDQLNRFRVNIHGHLHDTKLDDPRYVCVSAEQTNLTPIPWETIQEQLVVAGVL